MIYDLKIALVCPASLPATQFGGILFLCVDIARELSKIGNDITIFTTDMDFANNPKTFNKKLPRHQKIENYTISRSHVWMYFGLFFINVGMFRQLSSAYPEIIHSVGVRSFQSLIAALVAKKKNIPLVISDQGGLTTHPDLSNSTYLKKLLYKLQIPFIKFIISNASKIIAANDYEKQIFLNFCSEDKIAIVRNGINIDDITRQKINFKKKYHLSENFILFLGRFSKVKGIDILLKAINHIKKHPDMDSYKLVIMGVDFGFESEMLSLIERFQISDKIIVIKNPPREDVISAYRESEFLVLPSRWELSPLTPLEGFVFKKTVISTSAHGIPYTIEHNVNSILVTPDDYIGLADAIIELIQDEKKRIKLGESGYNLVQQICNSKNMAKETLKIYQSIINR